MINNNIVMPDVINLHFTDYCNYKCHYCFGNKKLNKLTYDEIIIVINNVKRYFDKYNIKGRINFVGGEIFLDDHLQDIIDYASKLNIKLSMVTNGFLLTKEFIINNKDKIDCIGISVDSLNHETNIKIGRCCRNKTLSKDRLVEVAKTIKDNGIKLKINMCLSKYNANEDVSDFISQIKPDRFKILQMMIVRGINDDQVDKVLSKEELNKCCIKYKEYNPIIEYNDEIRDSYLIVDSKGDFYCNKEKAIIGNLLIDELSDLVINSNINMEHYKKRYK